MSCPSGYSWRAYQKNVLLSVKLEKPLRLIDVIFVFISTSTYLFYYNTRNFEWMELCSPISIFSQSFISISCSKCSKNSPNWLCFKGSTISDIKKRKHYQFFGLGSLDRQHIDYFFFLERPWKKKNFIILHSSNFSSASHAGLLCDMASIVPMHVKPKFTYLLTLAWTYLAIFLQVQQTQIYPHQPTPAIERLGINPYVWDSECLSGQIETQNTAFPQSVGFAASFRWDDSLAPGKCYILKNAISEHMFMMLQIKSMITACETALRWMPWNTFHQHWCN